jgi:hypothetical protein
MVEYWSDRRRQALQSARQAQSVELRALYARVAAHCRSLEECCSRARSSFVSGAARGAVSEG